MNNLCIIASVTKDGSIGNSETNNLIKTDKEDFKLFKEYTEGNTVIMGRYTWESLPVKPLPNRVNIVVSSKLETDDAIVVKSLEEAFDHVEGTPFVIGGYYMFLGALEYNPDIIFSIWKDENLTGNIKFPFFKSLLGLRDIKEEKDYDNFKHIII